MTYGQILARASFLIWGSSPPDPETVDILYGSEGVIANVVRDIMQDYNYWFMAMNTAITVQGFVQSYTMPANFKEYRAAMWQQDTGDSFSAPLRIINTAEGILKWSGDDSDHAKYPDFVEVNGDSITLYPDPNPDYPHALTDPDYDATKTNSLIVLYWGYLNRPSDNTATFSAYSDEVTTRCADAVIYLSAAYMCDLNAEYDRAALFRDRAAGYIDQLKKEDKRRRQKAARMVLPMNHDRAYILEV